MAEVPHRTYVEGLKNYRGVPRFCQSSDGHDPDLAIIISCGTQISLMKVEKPPPQ